MNWQPDGKYAQRTDDGRYLVTKTKRGDSWRYSAFSRKPVERLGNFDAPDLAKSACENHAKSLEAA